MTGEELRADLQLHPRANPDFFDALVALHFLERDGDGPAARYRNTPETAAFLDRNSPQFMGGFLEMANARLYRFWGDLSEGLRTGKAQNELKHGGTSMFAEVYSKPERLEQFMEAMGGISAGNFHAFADKFDFSRYRTLCDIGGATGQLSSIVARKHPHMTCMSADLPEATTIAERKIAAAGLSDRVSARPLDFFADPLPKADVITMGMILHDWNLEKKHQLVRKTYDALPRGWGLCRHREPDRRCETGERVRVDDVAEHADRVRRSLRLHLRGLHRLVPRCRLQELRGDSAGRPGECGSGV